MLDTPLLLVAGEQSRSLRPLQDDGAYKLSWLSSLLMDLRPLDMDLGDASSAPGVSPSSILVMQTKINKLQAEVTSLQGSLEHKQPLCVLHEQTLAMQSFTISEIQELLDVYHLDPNEQSQSLQDLPDSLPSTQALLDYMNEDLGRRD